MANYDLFQRIVRAMALGEGASARDLIAQMPDEDQRDYVVYIAAAFTEFAETYFREDHGLVAIKNFVDEMAFAYRSSNPPFRPLAMEVLLRAVFDDDQSLDEVNAEEQLRFHTLALRMFAHKSPEIYAQLDQHLAEAASLAKEWLSEEP
jgi:hypothetical protein